MRRRPPGSTRTDTLFPSPTLCRSCVPRLNKAGGREAVEEDVARLQLGQPVLPLFGNRAFLRQQRPGAELERDGAKLGIVDPVLPFAQDRKSTRLNSSH